MTPPIDSSKRIPISTDAPAAGVRRQEGGARLEKLDWLLFPRDLIEGSMI